MTQDKPLSAWQILTIDTVASVNAMTKKSLEAASFLGKPLSVMEASSIQQAEQVLRDNPNVAVILLDTMADKHNEGLAFIHFIRTVLKNNRSRIILRTGYPSALPGVDLIEDHEIDGYIPKETMSSAQIKITVVTAIRAYHQIISTAQLLQALAGSIAHEMRNPLGQVKFSLDSIGHHLPNPTSRSVAQPLEARDLNALYSHVTQGQLAIKRGLQIIEMTLNEVGGKPIDQASLEYLDAGKVSQKAVDEYSFDTPSERNKVRVLIKNNFSFKANETIYVFLLFNLIKNALYYFKQHPQASLTITVDVSTVRVRDNGPGISPAVLPQLFGGFVTSGKAEGTGLGLAYCKRAMQAFGGDISCDSVLGEYTEFTLRFPVQENSEIKAHEYEVLAQATAQFKGKRILVVDDQAIMRKATRAMLGGLGAEFGEAENGEQAIERLQENTYDLIVMDLNMPVLDGYAAAEKIRGGAVPAQKHIAIVAYTAESAYMAHVKTEKVGMDGFVCKPCTSLELVKALQTGMEKARRKIRFENATTTVLAGKIVVVADDSAQNRRIIKKYLQTMGIKVMEAENGWQVIKLLESDVPVDAVLLDIQMPVMDGLKTARALRRSALWATLPIIALTAHFSDQHVQEALEAGMDDFISKPVEIDQLQAKLLTLLGSGAVRTKTQTPMAKPAPLITASAIDLKVKGPVEAIQVPLLNTRRLEEMKRIDHELLLETLPIYLDEMGQYLMQLDEDIQRKDFEDAILTLHKLLGHAGGCGAHALHQFLCSEPIYPTIANDRQWPTEENWLQTAKDLHAQTCQAMRETYLAEALMSPETGDFAAPV